MTRNNILLCFMIFSSCSVFFHKFDKQEIIFEKRGNDGRIICKQFRQLISSPGGNELATITQEYDTLGRVVKEYGFNNPDYGIQYLIENFYKDNKRTIINKFRWTKIDSTVFSRDYKNAFEMQRIFLSRGSLKKDIIIQKWSGDTTKFVGKYQEQVPLSDNMWETKEYEFELSWGDLNFDKDGRLVLDKIIRLPDK